MAELDIVIPVYNEGGTIERVLHSLRSSVRTRYRVLLCYDHDADDTLPVGRKFAGEGMAIELLKNRKKGAHGAVVTGLMASTAPAVVVYPADDDFNASILDSMHQKFQQGCDIVAASRFIPGGCMEGCPWLKAVLVRLSAFALYYLAGLPTHDPSSGFRLFSRRVVKQIPIESSEGFTYSLELLVKAHRLGWRVGEVPARWFERQSGRSRFRVLRWIPAYLRWFFYAFATRYLGRSASTVKLSAPATLQN